jgi:hypothetical protein
MDWIQECTTEQIFWNKGTVPWAKTRIDHERVVEQDPLDPGPDAFLAQKETQQTEQGLIKQATWWPGHLSTPIVSGKRIGSKKGGIRGASAKVWIRSGVSSNSIDAFLFDC